MVSLKENFLLAAASDDSESVDFAPTGEPWVASEVAAEEAEAAAEEEEGAEEEDDEEGAEVSLEAEVSLGSTTGC